MKIIVCDDNKSFGIELQRQIFQIMAHNDDFSDLNCSCDYLYPAKDLLLYASSNHIDILFLDINMPEINGLQIAEAFHDCHPETIIIFVSGFENYVFYAIRFNPFRFIRKERIENELEEATISAIRKLMYSNEFINIPCRKNNIRVNLSRIVCIIKEKEGNYVNIICVNEEYRSRDTISELEEKLKKNSFVKINSGAIVNLTQIVSLKKDRVILSNKSEYSISRKYQAIVKTKYMEYMRFQEMTKQWN